MKRRWLPTPATDAPVAWGHTDPNLHEHYAVDSRSHGPHRWVHSHPRPHWTTHYRLCERDPGTGIWKPVRDRLSWRHRKHSAPQELPVGWAPHWLVAQEWFHRRGRIAGGELAKLTFWWQHAGGAEAFEAFEARVRAEQTKS